MAIVLEANYAKKLGLPNFSSHQYSVTIRTELTDLTQVEAESTRLYGLLQEAVDREIQEVGFMPDASCYGMHHAPANGATHSQASNGHGNGYPSNEPNGRRLSPAPPVGTCIDLAGRAALGRSGLASLRGMTQRWQGLSRPGPRGRTSPCGSVRPLVSVLSSTVFNQAISASSSSPLWLIGCSLSARIVCAASSTMTVCGQDLEFFQKACLYVF